MGTEALFDRIVTAIKADLEAIVGDDGVTYWYTPGKVIRVDYTESRVVFKTGFGNPIYMVSDTGDDRVAPAGAFSESGRLMDVFVLCAYKDDRGDTDPYTTSLASGTVRNRMLKDVIKKLENDGKLGGLVDYLEHATKMRDFVEPAGWILGEAHFEVVYHHDIGDP